MGKFNVRRSVYRRGADDGLWFGIYLSVMFGVSVCAITISDSLSWLTMAMAAAVPAIIYFFLKRSYREDYCTSSFSTLWLHGICIFFFGCLLMAVTAYVYLRVINPAFYHDTIGMVLEMYDEAGISADNPNVKLLSAMQKNNMYPTAGQSAMELIMSGVLTGSILSMLISSIVRATTRQTTPPGNPQS